MMLRGSVWNTLKGGKVFEKKKINKYIENNPKSHIWFFFPFFEGKKKSNRKWKKIYRNWNLGMLRFLGIKFYLRIQIEK